MIRIKPVSRILLVLFFACRLPAPIRAQEPEQGYFTEHYLLKWNQMLPLRYPRAYDFFNQVAAVQWGDRWGIIDRDGNFVVEPLYTHISKTSGGIYILSDNLKQGLFFPSSGKIIPAAYNRVMGESDGLVTFYDGSHYGVCDLNGEVAIPPQFAMLERFSEGLASALVDGTPVRFGCIDREGNWVIKPRFTYISRFSEGKAAATPDGRSWGFIDHNGDWVIQPRPLPEMPEAFRRGFSKIGKAYIRSDGSWACDPELSEAKVVDDLCFYKQHDHWGWTDSAGAIRVPPIFDAAAQQNVSEDRVAVKKGIFWGFADRTGQVRVEPQFTAVQPFQEGMAAVRSGDLWGYINKRGDWVISPQYSGAGAFVQGLALVVKDQKEWLIDANGTIQRYFTQGVFFSRTGILTTTDVLTKSPKYNPGLTVFPLQRITTIGYAEGILHIGDSNWEGYLDAPSVFEGNTALPEIYWGAFLESDTLTIPASFDGGVMACVCSASAPTAEWEVDGIVQGPAAPLTKELWACPFVARWNFPGQEGQTGIHRVQLRVKNEQGQTESHFYYRLD